jgi:hypothetical protein
MCSKGKRFTRTEGPLKANLQNLKARRLRPVFRHCATSGARTVMLVEKRIRTKTAEQDGSDNNNSGCTKPLLRHDQPVQAKTNIYCGCGQPVPSPAGRFVAFGMVQNIDETNIGDLFSHDGIGSFSRANTTARKMWEHQTRKPFDLKSFLEPLARDILATMRSDEVQNYTVIVSKNVLETLLQIEREQISKDKNKKRTAISRKPSKLPKKFRKGDVENPRRFPSFQSVYWNIPAKFGWEFSAFWARIKSFLDRMKT